MSVRRHPAIAAAIALLVALALSLVLLGCGDDSDSGSGTTTSATNEITVYAAASLTDVFPTIDPAPEYNFAGSDTLATQIREGAPADVYAAANQRLPNELNADGLVEKPVPFATNRLVLLVEKGNPKGITGVQDLDKDGVTFVMADEGVPVGDYTRTVLENLGQGDLVAKAASQEDDVRAVTGKVALGEADAGFAYATDALAVADDVQAVELPADAQPPIVYAMAIVTGSAKKDQAQAVVDKVLSPEGQEALRAAGFGVP
jgi:molybdate transport system substrate-binding protein